MLLLEPTQFSLPALALEPVLALLRVQALPLASVLVPVLLPSALPP